MNISGEGRYFDKAGRRHKVEGFGSLPDDTALQSMKISGKLSFGKISCDEIKISGECFGDSLTAQNISVEGTLDVNSVEVAEILKLEGSLKVSHLEATKTLIESRSGSIGTVKCQSIKIFHNEDFVDSYNSRLQIKNIEADTVELENCSADIIRCEDAFIGSNCRIKQLFVAGKYRIATDSIVDDTIHT